MLHRSTSVKKTEDDDTLIDVHVGNPLKRITELLEDIKKQKAFSFTLKGSLGIMGVVLSLSLLGFFGTTHALCDKGVQTHIGRVKGLQAVDAEPVTIITKAKEAIDYFTHFFSENTTKQPQRRFVLETPDNQTIHLKRGQDVSIASFVGQAVYATGVYDSCSRQMKITDTEALEAYR